MSYGPARRRRDSICNLLDSVTSGQRSTRNLNFEEISEPSRRNRTGRRAPLRLAAQQRLIGIVATFHRLTEAGRQC